MTRTDQKSDPGLFDAKTFVPQHPAPKTGSGTGLHDATKIHVAFPNRPQTRLDA